jgi:hypothetical protein
MQQGPQPNDSKYSSENQAEGPIRGSLYRFLSRQILMCHEVSWGSKTCLSPPGNQEPHSEGMGLEGANNVKELLRALRPRPESC